MGLNDLCITVIDREVRQGISATGRHVRSIKFNVHIGYTWSHIQHSNPCGIKWWLCFFTARRYTY